MIFPEHDLVAAEQGTNRDADLATKVQTQLILSPREIDW